MWATMTWGVMATKGANTGLCRLSIGFRACDSPIGEIGAQHAFSMGVIRRPKPGGYGWPFGSRS